MYGPIVFQMSKVTVFSSHHPMDTTSLKSVMGSCKLGASLSSFVILVIDSLGLGYFSVESMGI